MDTPVAKANKNRSNCLTKALFDRSYDDQPGYVNMLDLKNPNTQQTAMEAFFFGYQAFTAKADEMLARRGLSRVHHRILFFIAKYPGLSMKELLGYLGVSKQALNTPLRQLLEMNLVQSLAAEDDKRKRLLGFTAEGAKLEQALRREQAKLLQRAFSEAGETAVSGWLQVNQTLHNSANEG
jgi:DNA-binding MarR family transcriptional regulator|tara:strand:+ start:10801 stop:11343 length:543 start_codon:yes stop_codon:yes gene_type:complete